MLTNPSAARSAVAPASDSFFPLQPVAASPAQPATVVLQPRYQIDDATIASFQAELEQALHRTGKAVIVDLMWVGAIDAMGAEALRRSLHLAHRLGKALLFQSLDWSIRDRLDVEQERLRTANLGSWAEAWQESFHQFLGDRQQARSPVEDCTEIAAAPVPLSRGKKSRISRIEREQSAETRVALTLQ